MGAPSYTELETQANRMAGTLVVCTRRIEELQEALRVVLGECCASGEDKCENVCHIKGWKALGRHKARYDDQE